MNPKARTERLIIEELDGETLVYDLDRDKAHNLNRVAAAVWRQCDGTTSVPQIAKQIAGSEKPSPDLVWFALRRLERAHLLATPLGARHDGALTRRQLMKRVGLAAAMIPVVSTILAPTAQAAASCLAFNATCATQVSGNQGTRGCNFTGQDPCCLPYHCNHQGPGDCYCQ
jgi:Coenzyme PQQ synthesis protein D (PqqD).